jgi:hypothetical protein
MVKDRTSAVFHHFQAINTVMDNQFLIILVTIINIPRFFAYGIMFILMLFHVLFWFAILIGVAALTVFPIYECVVGIRYKWLNRKK